MAKPEFVCDTNVLTDGGVVLECDPPRRQSYSRHCHK